MRKWVITGLILVVALAGGCAPDTSGPSTAATEYLVALDSGDAAGYCALEERSQSPEDREHCVEIASDGAHGYAEPPEVDRVEDWPATGGKVVIVQEFLSTTSTPQWTAVGVVEVDGKWLIRTFRAIEGDPQRDGIGAETLA